MLSEHVCIILEVDDGNVAVQVVNAGHALRAVRALELRVVSTLVALVTDQQLS